MRELRLFRRQMMVRIAWAQALSLVREEETLQQLSVLAETLIVAAATGCTPPAVKSGERHATPRVSRSRC